MKFKFLSFIMAAAVALAFTSCDNKTAASKSDASDASKSEQVEEKAKVFEPTGDAAADAKQCADELFEQMNKTLDEIKTADDAMKLEDKMEEGMMAIEKKYEEFYKAKGEDQVKLFKDEFDKLENDPVYSKKFEEFMIKAQKKVEELTKAVEDVKEKVEK